MSSGSRIAVYYAVEQSVGVLPTTPIWKTLRRVTDGLNESITTEDSDEVTDSRYRQGGLAVSAEITGELAFELSLQTFDDFFEAVAMNAYVGNVLTVGGTTRKTFTIVKHYKDINQVFIYRGMHVNTAHLEIPASGKITGTFGLMGTGFERTTTSPVVDPLPPTDTPILSQLHVSTVTINGTALTDEACLSNLTLDINNNLEGIVCIGNNELAPQKYIEKRVDITASATVAFSPTSAAWIDRVKSRETMALVVPMEDTQGNEWTISLPELEVTEAGHPDGGGDDIINLDVSFANVRSAPTFTRVVAP